MDQGWDARQALESRLFFHVSRDRWPVVTASAAGFSARLRHSGDKLFQVFSKAVSGERSHENPWGDTAASDLLQEKRRLMKTKLFQKNVPGVITACVGLKQFMRDRRAHDTENAVFRRRCSAQNRFARSSRSRFNRFEMLLPQGCCEIGTSWAKGEGKGGEKGGPAPGGHKKRPEAGWRTSDLEGDGNSRGAVPDLGFEECWKKRPITWRWLP